MTDSERIKIKRNKQPHLISRQPHLKVDSQGQKSKSSRPRHFTMTSLVNAVGTPSQPLSAQEEMAATEASARPTNALSFHTFFPPPLPELTVTSTGPEDFQYFGLDSDFDMSLAIIYLQAHVTGNVHDLVAAFFHKIREDHLTPEHTAFWFTVRIWSEATTQFEVPRWHQDGEYWTMQPDEIPYKIGTVFTGAPTVFIHPLEEYTRAIQESDKRLTITNYNAEEIAIERLWLAEQFKNARVSQAKPGELARWAVAREDLAVIHSEPLIHQPRIFLSFLPGTEAQIRELAKNRYQPFVDEKTI